ncbi:multidrug efflux SMR transporter [Deefgea tanakiae]|jgi:quaternary ammonium compound-resistance protein SugE|uniref:Guanidinium exporter n=1 Tax=Deefgea tanakiae TaxID=2865840 RepID=A0ABX8Z8E3_9NEIS|nr:multidrug efflux SMR transporter [Deefgea tanakiae]QZA77363.1 multidrug efflux SMR transporter [Deefgea tanakiae]
MSALTQAWLYLLAAGLCEIGWPLGFKLSQTTNYPKLAIAASIVSIGVSGFMLWLAQKQIPIGTAYAVWTGIGAAGTFAVGVLWFNDPLTVMRSVGAMMIVGGVIVMKLAH